MEQQARISTKVWSLLFCVWGAQAAAYTIRFGYGMMMPGILEDMAGNNLTPGILGNIVGLGSLATMLLTIPISIITVKFNPKIAVPITICFMAVGLLLFGFSSSVPQMYAGYILAFAFLQAIGTMLVMVKVKGVPTSRMTQVNGIENFLGPTGQVVATLAMAGILALLGGWRGVYIGCALVQIVACVIYVFRYGKDVVIEGAAAPEAAKKDELGALQSLKIAWSRKEVWLISLAWPGTTIVWLAMFNYWPTYAIKNLGISLGQAGMVLACIPVFSAIASLTSPFVSKKVGYDKPLIWPWGFILPPLYYCLTQVSSVPLLCLIASVIGYGCYFFVPMAFTVIYKLGMPARAVSMGMGTVLSFISLGGYIAGSAVGWMTDHLGLQQALAYSCLSPLWFGVLMLLFLPELGRKKMEAMAAAKDEASAPAPARDEPVGRKIELELVEAKA